jgi:hypothetical protein
MAEVQFALDIPALERLADGALLEVGALIAPRVMTPVEAGLMRSVFWARASAADGNWISLLFDFRGARLVLDRAWERGFIAQAMRMLGARKLALVSIDYGIFE